ncbi:MAG: alcohol dehydrogenase catalytic domain-containing protein [Victivallales bacterium]|nr:alcohol dehydrogenase catalytic domain-containing protein [Victivallales bacterium]
MESVCLPEPGAGEKRLRVLCCSLCRTDAKLCHSGHRDMRLPVIPGHEFCGIDPEDGKMYAVWPGVACGKCELCLKDMGNMCSSLQIIGFHRDGGLAEFANVPETSLVQLPYGLPCELAAFAEPMACAINALDLIGLASKERIAVFGAGPLGLMAAKSAKALDADVLLVENSPEKRERVGQICRDEGIPLADIAGAAGFDKSLNATAAPDAFNACMEALAPGGGMSFFSALPPESEPIPVRQLNDLHYRQIALKGAYGCTKGQMSRALDMINCSPAFFRSLTEKQIGIEDVPGYLERLPSGRYLKFAVCFDDPDITTQDKGHCRQ